MNVIDRRGADGVITHGVIDHIAIAAVPAYDPCVAHVARCPRTLARSRWSANLCEEERLCSLRLAFHDPLVDVERLGHLLSRLLGR